MMNVRIFVRCSSSVSAINKLQVVFKRERRKSRLNSIITQHFLISLLILMFTVGYVYFGVVFT